MIKRLIAATVLITLLIVAGGTSASADSFKPRPVIRLYAFGDSLTDTGNLFALSGGFEPPSPPYSNGRFSNGPVWIETFATLLDPKRDFETTPVTMDPLANNQAVGGAFTDTRNANQGVIPSSANTGILGQIANFEDAGGKIRPNDLVVVWGGANNYIFDPVADPVLVVDDLKRAVEELADLGGRRFLVPNLPNLGDTPFGFLVLSPEGRAFLNLLTQAHNTGLAEAMAELREDLGIRIVLPDINATFSAILADPTSFGFVNTVFPCLIQNPDGTRTPTGACPPEGDSFNATGTLFWDLIHPTAAAHALVALTAYTTLTAAHSMTVPSGD